jgi:hypothetical protein
MNKPNQIREALFASQYPIHVKGRLSNWLNKQHTSVRANLKIALIRQAQARQAAYDNTHSGYHIHSWID